MEIGIRIKRERWGYREVVLKRDKELNRIERKGKREKRIKYDGEGGSELKKNWYKVNMLNLFLNFCMCV